MEDIAANTAGNRIRDLFEDASNQVIVIAPFLKIDAMKSLMGYIPSSIHLKCVTRWLPHDVAAGVSDPEIIKLLQRHSNSEISLVDKLHAKLYIADQKCLIGSANVTLAALGDGLHEGNVEVLVETTTDDPGIATTLEIISKLERPASEQDAERVRQLADSMEVFSKTFLQGEARWFPQSRRCEEAYEFYKQPIQDYLSEMDKILLNDLARANLPPGLNKEEFNQEIKHLLSKNPIAEQLFSSNEDQTFTRADALPYLKPLEGSGYTASDLWEALVNWISYYFPDKFIKQDIAEIGLRRAQNL